MRRYLVPRATIQNANVVQQEPLFRKDAMFCICSCFEADDKVAWYYERAFMTSAKKRYKYCACHGVRSWCQIQVGYLEFYL
jgi:hypothetical protein